MRSDPQLARRCSARRQFNFCVNRKKIDIEFASFELIGFAFAQIVIDDSRQFFRIVPWPWPRQVWCRIRGWHPFVLKPLVSDFDLKPFGVDSTVEVAVKLETRTVSQRLALADPFKPIADPFKPSLGQG